MSVVAVVVAVEEVVGDSLPRNFDLTFRLSGAAVAIVALVVLVVETEEDVSPSFRDSKSILLDATDCVFALTMPLPPAGTKEVTFRARTAALREGVKFPARVAGFCWRD